MAALQGYQIPMTQQALATDQLECVGIAREQAFLGNTRDRLCVDVVCIPGRRQSAREFCGTIPSLAEPERRYHRVCTLACGYELVALDELRG
jgi:hypothetical protein